METYTTPTEKPCISYEGLHSDTDYAITKESIMEDSAKLGPLEASAFNNVKFSNWSNWPNLRR